MTHLILLDFRLVTATAGAEPACDLPVGRPAACERRWQQGQAGRLLLEGLQPVERHSGLRPALSSQ